MTRPSLTLLDHLSPPPTYKRARELSESENKFLPTFSSSSEDMENPPTFASGDLEKDRSIGGKCDRRMSKLVSETSNIPETVEEYGAEQLFRLDLLTLFFR